MAKKWISKAIEPSHRGEFKAKAEKAGMSTKSFAKEKEHAPGKTGAQARLAETLMGMHKDKPKSRGSVMYDHKSMKGR